MNKSLSHFDTAKPAIVLKKEQYAQYDWLNEPEGSSDPYNISAREMTFLQNAQK